MGIDFLLGRREDLGRGMGSKLVAEHVARVEALPDVRRIVADPLSGNVRSIRALEASGFRFDERSGLYVRERRRDADERWTRDPSSIA
jgi:RimJ/RimL family protein N-acetyltransferase